MSAGPFAGIGPALRGLRVERGLTQAQVAERAGVSKTMLSLYERDRVRPHLDTLGRILDALGVRLVELAARVEEVQKALRRAEPGGGS